MSTLNDPIVKGKENNLSPSRWRSRRWLLLLSLTLVSHFAYGQQTIHPSLLKAETFSHSLLPDSIEAPSSRESKSTMLAMAFSAVLPGAGQVYTERYWKIPIIWGFGIYFGSVWNRANISYKEARDKYQASLDQGVNAGGGDAQLRYERDFYRDERDRFAFYIALTYLLNIVDAYVGASLYNFDVSDYLGGNARISIQIPVR